MYFIIILFAFFFIILPQIKNGFTFIGISALSLLVIFSVKYTKRSNSSKNLSYIFLVQDIILLIIGSLSTYYLSKHIGSITAAGFVGFLSFLIGRTYPKLLFAQFPIFCGSFVGMTNYQFFNDLDIFLASIIAGVIYINVKNHFLGFGGKLGAIAFSGVMIILVLKGFLYG